MPRRWRHTPEEALKLADDRIKAPRRQLLLALDGDLTITGRELLAERLDAVKFLERKIYRLEKTILAKMGPWHEELAQLQTIPGASEMSAAMLLLEVGPDMEAFKTPDRLASWPLPRQ
jgi:transposase